jgi:DNA-binding winged helix-turn-helix (wHTH) protein
MTLRFGRFTLDVDQRRLWDGDDEIRLAPKAFELLKLLIENRPRALSKDEIIARVWPGTFITENNLATLVRDLRAALGDQAGEPSYIRTAYGFGYAFTGVATEMARSTVAIPAASRWRLFGEQGEIQLLEGENFVGRSGPGVLAIDSSTVSRNHARLTITGNRLFCEDLGSKNGTWRGKARVTSLVEVQDGDELRFGSVVLVARCARSDDTTETINPPA